MASKKTDKTVDHISSYKPYYSEKQDLWKSELSYYVNGKRCRKNFCGKTKEILLQRIEAFKNEFYLIGNVDSDLRFDKFATNWMLNKEIYRLKPSSYDTKMRTLTKYVIPAIGHIPVNRLKYKDIQNMVNDLAERGLSYSTVKKTYEVITCCHKYYRIISGCSFNPAEGVELPQNIKPDLANHKYFTSEERKRLEREISRTYKNGAPVYRFAPIMILLMYTGLRVGEALALTWDDIKFQENLIDINKSTIYIPVDGKYKHIVQDTGKTESSMRVLPMSRKAREALIQLKAMSGGNNLVISTVKGNSPNGASLGKSLTRMSRNAGVITKDEYRSVHTLRHTFATMLFENGCSIKIVSELLGHCDTRVTENTYIHVIQKQKIKAIEDLDKYCV